MDVVVEGVERFRLLELQTTDKPFAVGEVEMLLDEEVAQDPVLLTSCLETYNTIVHLVYGATGPVLTHEELGPRPSFEMAPKSGLSLEQKQALLEASSENARCEVLHAHLQELLPMITRAEAVQRVVQSDGYLRAVL
jgi:Lon protease-like protein